MNYRILILAATAVVPNMVFGQAAFDGEIDEELAQVTAGRTSPQNAEAAPTGAAIAPQGPTSGQPIYILNQATPTSSAQVQQTQTGGQLQKQPQVDIVGSPLTKSRAEQIREARQQSEIETENKVVERLEASRMEDEKRRAAVLFGQPFDRLSNQNNINAENVNVNNGQQGSVQQSVQQQQVQQIPVQVVPAPVVIAPHAHEDEDRDDDRNRHAIREEIRAAMESERHAPEEVRESHYFGAMVGMTDYPDVGNVRGNYTLGAMFGTRFDDAVAVEGAFTYADYTVEPNYYGPYWNYGFTVPQFVETRQYAGSIAAKYLFLDGMVKPTVGGILQYSYRTFSWSYDPYSYYTSTTSAASHAIDVGASAGVDLDFKKRFTVGLDFRYFWNMASRVNTDSYSRFLTTAAVFGTPIEKLQYYTLSLTGKVNF